MDTVEKAERFLHPALEQLYPPLMMQDMDKAVTLLRQAIAAHQPIMIYGDYDVDGVCATSIMLETLREEGAQADYYIPSRHGEGYGLNCDAVREIAKTHKLRVRNWLDPAAEKWFKNLTEICMLIMSCNT